MAKKRNSFCLYDIASGLVIVSFLMLKISTIGGIAIERYLIKTRDDRCAVILKLFEQCDKESTDECFYNAIKLESMYPNDWFFQHIMASLLYKRGDKEKSLYYLEKSLTSRSYCFPGKPHELTSITILYDMSRVYRELGNIDRSVDTEKKATELLKKTLGESYSPKVKEKFMRTTIIDTFKNNR